MECTWCLGLFFAALDLGEEDWHSIEARDLEKRAHTKHPTANVAGPRPSEHVH